MQLFISSQYTHIGSKITIQDPRIVHQLKNVLRFQAGERFCIQNTINNMVERITLSCDGFEKNTLISTIEKEESIPLQKNNYGMIISLLNKKEKMEMIIQKLTEIGIQQIIFWKSERSVIKEIGPKTLERRNLIALEATEQSWGLQTPHIEVIEKIQSLPGDSTLILFESDGENFNLLKKDGIGEGSVYGCIGPEGGFGPYDYNHFDRFKIIKASLGSTILRSETAAIIGGRTLTHI